MAVICVSVLLIIVGFICTFFPRKFAYWTKKGVYNPPPAILYGNLKKTMRRKEHLGMEISEIYGANKDKPFVGLYAMFRPTFLVIDLNFVKNVMTKDFWHFSYHGIPFSEETDPLEAHLFNLGGRKWKNLRAKLTPTFTSSKMKRMFNVVAETAMEMGEYLDERIMTSEVDDVKEVLGKFGNDVIASCAFGVECKSFKNPDDAFRKMGRRTVTPNARERLLTIIDFLMPEILSKLKVSVLGKDINDFFYKIAKETVEYRENNGVIRDDFMQLLIELKNNGYVSDEKGM